MTRIHDSPKGYDMIHSDIFWHFLGRSLICTGIIGLCYILLKPPQDSQPTPQNRIEQQLDRIETKLDLVETKLGQFETKLNRLLIETTL